MPTLKVELPFKVEDDRGVIQNVLFETISSVALITSKKGTERSNHWHKTNAHYLYVLNGKVRYHEKNVDGSGLVVEEFGQGEMFFTGPQKVHLCEFLEDTTLLSLNLQPRGPEHDNEDTVREKFYADK